MFCSEDRWAVLTPSPPQPVKFPGWQMHDRACKQCIFWSYNTSHFNAVRFVENPFTCLAKGRQKDWRVSDFALLFVVFKCHHGSERVKHKHRKRKYWFHEASPRWPLNRSFFKRQRRRNRRADTTANKGGGVKQWHSIHYLFFGWARTWVWGTVWVHEAWFVVSWTEWLTSVP